MTATAPRDWDARTYDRISGPMLALGREVVDRLHLMGSETVIDAGCGSGRVTELIIGRLPRGRVIAVDASPSMIELVRARLRPGDRAIACDLLELELDAPADAILSTATFHWILDHAGLFGRLHAALRPGGCLEAQCGGEGNVARLHACAEAVAREDPFARFFSDWSGPWRFAAAEQTAALLRGAGFERVRCWLEPRPVSPPEPLAYLETVCLGTHLERLPADLRRRYAEGVLARMGGAPELDYVRLNISARRPCPTPRGAGTGL